MDGPTRHLALFDFDHTVTHCDTYSRFLRRVATPEQLAGARWAIGPWLLGYRAGLVSAAAIRRRVTRFAFAGRDAGEIAALAEAYAREELPGLVRPEALQRIEWHRAQGHTLVLVSASLDLYLVPWCVTYGFDVVCNRLEEVDGRLTGRYQPDDCGPHKVREIRARFDPTAFERVYAYGDSREDRPMLALAHERWYRGRRIA
ncbi:HAD family hydrolase [Luteimonas yindakuii]|uniref:HAD family hydrolase n=1 Tax=Luteimonas yindakuii TaxID=2565782 RepID=UPI0010A3791C|nr:HAD family hydrolase [Luteimonas yindakuii]QCO67943.1 HAD family hydrolase [Luteimonas yindakuii]